MGIFSKKTVDYTKFISRDEPYKAYYDLTMGELAFRVKTNEDETQIDEKYYMVDEVCRSVFSKFNHDYNEFNLNTKLFTFGVKANSIVKDVRSEYLNYMLSLINPEYKYKLSSNPIITLFWERMMFDYVRKYEQ